MAPPAAFHGFPVISYSAAEIVEEDDMGIVSDHEDEFMELSDESGVDSDSELGSEFGEEDENNHLDIDDARRLRIKSFPLWQFEGPATIDELLQNVQKGEDTSRHAFCGLRLISMEMIMLYKYSEDERQEKQKKLTDAQQVFLDRIKHFATTGDL